MAFDEATTVRVRSLLEGSPGYAEKKMIGGLTFMVRGHMCCGVVKDELMVRVGPDQNDEALSLPYARPMDFTGKPMNGFIYVARGGLTSDDDLAGWVDRGLKFNSTMPAK